VGKQKKSSVSTPKKKMKGLGKEEVKIFINHTISKSRVTVQACFRESKRLHVANRTERAAAKASINTSH